MLMESIKNKIINNKKILKKGGEILEQQEYKD